MAASATHPSIPDLQAYTLGTLDDSYYLAVEAHILACPACQERAAVLPGDRFTELLRSAHTAMHGQPNAGREWSQEQITTPLVADRAVTPSPAGGLADPGSDGPGVPDAVPPELSRHERYRVVRLVGQGGMGVVYQAEHRFLHRSVAVKVIKRAFTAVPAIVERFRREVRAAARLSHPNVVTTHDAEDVGEMLFIVMEYVEGDTLGRLVTEYGPLPVAQACDYARQAASGLQHAHECGMVHRDVKPYNLIRCPDGTVKVLDFGLAVLSAERGAGLTDVNAIMGTPEYMAPEQAEDARNADPRSDVYSLGCTLYHLLTGDVPYPAPTSLLKILAHRERPLPSLQTRRPVPPALAAIVARMMARKPEDRYQTAGEVASALEPFTRPVPVKAARKRPTLLIAAVAALLLGIAGGVFVIKTDQGEITIRTDDPAIEVVVGKGGRVVRLRDPVSGKTWELDTDRYQIGLADEPDGLTISLEQGQTVTLRRKSRSVVTVSRSKVGPPPPAITPEGEGTAQVLQRFPLKEGAGWKMVAVARDGRLVAANSNDDGSVFVWDGKTGKELYRFPTNGLVNITPDGSRLIFYSFANRYGDLIRVYESATGRLLFEFRLPAPAWSMSPLPDNRHVLIATGHQKIELRDLEGGRLLQSWPFLSHPWYASTSDGKYVVVKPGGENFLTWDVQGNRPSEKFATLARCEIVWSFQPGDKAAFVREGGKDYLMDLADGKNLGPPAYVWPQIPFVTMDRCPTDFRILLSGDEKSRQIAVSDTRTGKAYVAFTLPPGEKPIRGPSVNLSLDGRYAGMATTGAVYLLRLPTFPPSTGRQ